MIRHPPTSPLFPSPALSRSVVPALISATVLPRLTSRAAAELFLTGEVFDGTRAAQTGLVTVAVPATELDAAVERYRSEEHTSELQSRLHLVCRLLLEKKKSL